MEPAAQLNYSFSMSHHSFLFSHFFYLFVLFIFFISLILFILFICLFHISYLFFVSKGTGASAKQVRSEQLALNELEFEWLRQFYIQGNKHYEMHKWQVLEFGIIN